MGSIADDAPLVVIVGPTASGKTALALEIARRFHGEIIAGDSRTVYIGADIGTAKPTAQEQAMVPHHLIDVAMPSEQFTVADFQKQARAAIADVSARGKLPILVGGSGLYIDAVIYNFSLRGGRGAMNRERYAGLSVDELQKLLSQKDIPLPQNSRNPRHLIRSLESNGQAHARQPLRPHTVIIGLDPGREVLRQKISSRVAAMVAAGLVDEVRRLAGQYGWDAPALQAPAYRAFRGYVEGGLSLERAEQLFAQNDMRYAKRQQTWFKRNPDIHWISKTTESVALVTTLLNK